jgi:hypothetical protein
VLTRFYWQKERALAPSLGRFFAVPAEITKEAEEFFGSMEAANGRPVAAAAVAAGPGAVVFRRNPDIKGPMSAFAYDYFADHYRGAHPVRLLDYAGLRGEGGDYAYEVLNFVDGHRTVAEIRDAVSAIYGPIPVDVVGEYLTALGTIDVVRH